MKRVLCVLLILITVICSVPAFAVSAAEDTYVSVNSFEELKSVISDLTGGDSLTVGVPKNITFTETLTVNKKCKIKFEPQNGIDKSLFAAQDSSGRAFYLDAGNVELEFSDVCMTGFNMSENGGAVYIAGEKCSIIGAVFDTCHSDANGGAIYIDGSNCAVDRCNFVECTAGCDGGGVYVSDDSYDCFVNNCVFGLGCQCDGNGQYVRGNNETQIKMSEPDEFNNMLYYQCLVNYLLGSVISGGRLWIVITMIMVMLIGGAAFAIIKRKKTISLRKSKKSA